MPDPSALRYQPTWDSLAQYTPPAWYTDARLGIFVHWGVYAVPAYGSEWYPRQMYQRDRPAFQHHREKWGPQSEFGYKDFIPMLTGQRFDPDALAALFRQAGARYVVAVAEHHDGFVMYDTDRTEWNAARMGPCRDVIGELAAATRAQDLVFGVSNHRAEHWFYYNGGREFDSDVQDPRYAGLYGPAVPRQSPALTQTYRKLLTPGGSVPILSQLLRAVRGRAKRAPGHLADWRPRPHAAFLDEWLARCVEVVDKYQPQIVYFDWWIEQIVFQPYLQKFAAYYYNRALEWDTGVVINHKYGAFPPGVAVYDLERGKETAIRERPWQTCTSVSERSWGYIEDDRFKSATTLVHSLVDTVSKNGNLLLNVGPRADGTLPDEATALLVQLGEWLKVNGEAIYATRPWHVYGEGNTRVRAGTQQEASERPFTASDIRFTQRDGALYAICLGWPGATARIRSLRRGSALAADQIAAIHLLGVDTPLTWSQDASGLTIHTPPAKPCDHAFAFRITLKPTP